MKRYILIVVFFLFLVEYLLCFEIPKEDEYYDYKQSQDNYYTLLKSYFNNEVSEYYEVMVDGGNKNNKKLLFWHLVFACSTLQHKYIVFYSGKNENNVLILLTRRQFDILSKKIKQCIKNKQEIYMRDLGYIVFTPYRVLMSGKIEYENVKDVFRIQDGQLHSSDYRFKIIDFFESFVYPIQLYKKNKSSAETKLYCKQFKFSDNFFEQLRELEVEEMERIRRQERLPF